MTPLLVLFTRNHGAPTVLTANDTEVLGVCGSGITVTPCAALFSIPTGTLKLTCVGMTMRDCPSASDASETIAVAKRIWGAADFRNLIKFLPFWLDFFSGFEGLAWTTIV